MNSHVLLGFFNTDSLKNLVDEWNTRDAIRAKLDFLLLAKLGVFVSAFLNEVHVILWFLSRADLMCL